MRFGSLTNQLMEGSVPVPEVGMGVTRLGWSDRRPYTIVKVISPKKIVVQEDDAKRTDDNGMSECQTYEYTRNDKNPEVTLTLRSYGWRQVGDGKNGEGWRIGERSRYHDYSF